LSIPVKNCGKKCGFFIKVALFELTIHLNSSKIERQMIVHLPFRFFRGKSAGDARSYRHGEGNLYGKEVYLGPGPGNHKFQSHHFQQKG
jgi:hypothetical protein